MPDPEVLATWAARVPPATPLDLDRLLELADRIHPWPESFRVMAMEHLPRDVVMVHPDVAARIREVFPDGP